MRTKVQLVKIHGSQRICSAYFKAGINGNKRVWFRDLAALSKKQGREKYVCKYGEYFGSERSERQK